MTAGQAQPVRRRGATALRTAALLPAAALAVLAVWAAATPARPGGAGSWVAKAVASPVFLACGAVLAVSAAALVALAGAMWRAGAAERRRRRAQHGTILLEFALVLPIALTLVLVMAQSSLLMVGNLCVNYAAYCAARSAIVQVPDNLAPAEGPNVIGVDPYSSPKLLRIQSAAVWAVLPVSCGSQEYPEGDAARLNQGVSDLLAGYGADAPGWVGPYLARKLRYAQDHTTVELDPPVGGMEYAPAEDIVARVSHTFYLSIPYANWVFQKFAGADGVDLAFGQGERGMVIRADCTLTNQGVQDYVDVEQFPPQ